MNSMKDIWVYRVWIGPTSTIGSVDYGIFSMRAVRNLPSNKAYSAFIGTVVRTQNDSLFIGVL